ncbi:MAG: hypothetical protein K8L99_26350, partial [Anaerolineae bacterium]|nr:hypothetical protein [Anaerolineae bacterium]
SQGNTVNNLSNITSHRDFKPGCIYIIPDFTELGIKIESLADLTVNMYQEALTEEKAYLILTTTPSEEFNKHHIEFNKISTTGIDLNAVLEKHIRFHYRAFEDDEPVVALLRENRQEIIRMLARPKQIATLFSIIQRDPPESVEALNIIIRQITNRQTSTLRRWFRDLDMNTKVFVMLVALLEENGYAIKLHQAEEIYYSFIQMIRRKPGMDGEKIFIDPRRIGIQDILADGNIIDNNQIIEFSDPVVRDHIVKVEIDNYYGLLWVLAEMLVDQIAPNDIDQNASHLNPAVFKYIGNPDIPRPMFVNVREVLANLVGYIGVKRENKLRVLLNTLTFDNDYRVKQLVGHMMRPVARDPSNYTLILDVLGQWIYPHKSEGDADEDENDITSQNNPDTFYASIQVIREIYGSLIGGDSGSELRAKLRNYLIDMGEQSGRFDLYIDEYDRQSQVELHSIITRVREEQGDKAITDNQASDAFEALQQTIALHALHITERSILSLIFMLDELIHSHPEDVVAIVRTWLEHGIAEVKHGDTGEDDIEDRAIAHLLSLEDGASSDDSEWRDQNERKRRERRHSLDSMAWHVGVMAANLLYEQQETISRDIKRTQSVEDDAHKSDSDDDEISEHDFTPVDATEEDAGELATTDLDSDEENDEAESELDGDQSDSESDEVDNITNQEAERPVGKHVNDQVDIIDADADAKQDQIQILEEHIADPATREKKKTKPKQLTASRQQRNNRLSVMNTLRPLLSLLPLLLQSSTTSLNAYTLIRNVTWSDRVWKYYRTKDIPFDFEFVETQALLQTSPIRKAFRSIRDWYGILSGSTRQPNKEGQKLWMDEVYPQLLNLFNTATHGQRPLLRELLFTEGWIDSRFADIRQVSHALLARSYILDGQLVDLPATRYGVVLIDGGLRQYNWDRYYQSIYRIIQRLAVIAPLHIYRLGSTKRIKRMGLHENEIQLQQRELRPRRTRSRLLAPLLEAKDSSGKALIDPEKTHFVLVLSPIEQVFEHDGVHPDLLDLPDLLSAATTNTSTQSVDPKWLRIINDPLYTDKEKEEARQNIEAARKSEQVGSWAWQRKLFIISPNKRKIIDDLNQQVLLQLHDSGRKRFSSPVQVEDYIGVIGVSDRTFLNEMDVIERSLSGSIGKMLHQMEPQLWHQDLVSIWEGRESDFGVGSDFDLQDKASVKAQIDQWIAQLGDITRARHPRDITMTIIWMILTLSRYELETAVELVCGWMEDNHVDPIVGENQQIMGLACTKSLFNFYRLDPAFNGKAVHYKPLLDLLPSFTRSKRGQDADEFLQVLSIVLLWARDDDWSTAIYSAGHDGPLQSSV